MFQVVSEQITEFLIRNQVVQKDDRELYQFGIQQTLFIILNLSTTIAIGILCGMLWQSIVFIIAYIPLRHYSGGFHARTPINCYFFSSIMVFTVLSVMKLFPVNCFICDIVILFSLLIIFILSPLADKNKPLNNEERTVYKRRVRMISFAELIIIAICQSLSLVNMVCCMTLSMGCIGLLLILGWIKSNCVRFLLKAFSINTTYCKEDIHD